MPYKAPRRSAALFYPGAGTWNVIWNPTILSSGVQSCQYGSGAGDQPIAGLDRDLDKRTDMALFRANSFDDPGKIYTRLSVNGACNGVRHNVSCTWCSRIRRRVWAVSDMTGDGKPEILMLQPDFGTLRWLTSESDYTQAPWRELGDPGAVVL